MNGPKTLASKQSQEARSRPTCPPNQSHLVDYWEALTDQQQSQLAEQIAQLDFEQIQSLHSAQQASDEGRRIAEHAIAPTSLISLASRRESPKEFAEACDIGWQTLRNGQVAIVLVAGGEGSRLGFPHPKGLFPIGPVSNKSLYQLLAEKTVAISNRAGTVIPYYVMTSDATHEETIAFFKAHSFFGLEAKSVQFFQQGTMPAVDQGSGKVLMSGQDRIVFSPDGHGGLLEAMRKARLFDDLRSRGIHVLFYHQVDNPLVRVCDPAFIGFHVLREAEVSTKVVAKEDPSEKVGLLVEVDGRHHMVEYTDLPAKLAEQLDESGGLRLRCGNTAVHLFGAEFLERMSKTELPFHRSSKSVPSMSESGELVEPTENNAFKFERFIFDILPHAVQPQAMEVNREEEFVPLKNREGQFSPEHVRDAMRRLHTKWMKRAGWTREEELPIEIPSSSDLHDPLFTTSDF